EHGLWRADAGAPAAPCGARTRAREVSMGDPAMTPALALAERVNGRVEVAERRRLPLWLGRLLRRRTAALAALLLLVIFAAALSARFVAPYDPLEMHARDRFQGPSARYWLGT